MDIMRTYRQRLCPSISVEPKMKNDHCSTLKVRIHNYFVPHFATFVRRNVRNAICDENDLNARCEEK